jgi:ABC-type transporter Mla maintaining outer membrane lipid asymmetry ATPase subunit MlaF
LFGADFRARRNERQAIQRRFGTLSRMGALLALTVFENVALPLRELRVLDERMIRDLVMLKLHMVQIGAQHAGKRPAELSGGMVKRVALARALALDPELLILDEPTAGLDPYLSRSFVRLIKSISGEYDLTVFMVTHDIETLSLLASRVAVLAEGTIVADGPLHDVMQDRRPVVAGFFGGLGPAVKLCMTWKPDRTRSCRTVHDSRIALATTFVWFRGDARGTTSSLVSKLAVNGLYPQATVRFRGVEVGKVETISLDSRDARNILVRIKVDDSVPITRGTYAQLGYQGVTGIAYILLDDDGTDPGPLQVRADGLARIEVRGNAFDDLAESSKVLLKQAGELLDRLNSMVNAENQARLANTLSNFERASARLEPALKAIPDVAERARKLLGEENQQSLRRSLENLEQVTGTIAPVAEDSRRVPTCALSEKLTARNRDLRGNHGEHPSQGERSRGTTRPRLARLSPAGAAIRARAPESALRPIRP